MTSFACAVSNRVHQRRCMRRVPQTFYSGR